MRPNIQQGDKIRQIVEQHDADMLAKLEQKPPAAFVFFDGAPLTSEDDAFTDFADHCPHSAPWMRARYKLTQRFGHDQVWLRSDLAEGVAASPERHENGDEASP